MAYQETAYNGTYAVSRAIQEQSTDGVRNTGWVTTQTTANVT